MYSDSFVRAQELVERPGESLTVELKRWINPDEPDGIAKIVKTVLALRNQDGGFMILGFNNGTLTPDINAPPEVKSLFHIDKIQGMISKYASEPFEIKVEYPQRNGQEFPVIVVPSGVKTPVATKSELQSSGNILIRLNTVYVRSLSANNTPSTTQAVWNDWPDIIDICFNNREADLGHFVRRQLGSLTPDLIRMFTSVLSESSQPQVPTETAEDQLGKFLQESKARFRSVLAERQIHLPEYGAWEVALIINGNVPQHRADTKFLNLLASSNPRYTGWPIWLDSRGLGDSARPYVFEGVWEAFVPGLHSEIDFMRLDPKGRFYLRRILEDDLQTRDRAP